jgi:hypothetical protein
MSDTLTITDSRFRFVDAHEAALAAKRWLHVTWRLENTPLPGWLHEGIEAATSGYDVLETFGLVIEPPDEDGWQQVLGVSGPTFPSSEWFYPLATVLAPYVWPGSYLQVEEDAGRRRYVWSKTTCTYVTPEVVWPKPRALRAPARTGAPTLHGYTALVTLAVRHQFHDTDIDAAYRAARSSLADPQWLAEHSKALEVLGVEVVQHVEEEQA